MMQSTKRRPVKEQMAQHNYAPPQRQKRRFAGPDDDAYTDDELYDSGMPRRIPNSTRRYTQAPRTQIRVTHHDGPPVRRASAHTTQDQTERQTRPQVQQSKQPVHWLLLIGMGMLVMLVVWAGSSIIVSLGQTTYNDLHYGRPRTSQYDVQVGHNDGHTPSHFVAMNLSGRAVVVEFPGGDATHARVYIGPIMASGHELDPVTLAFKDVNGDGKPDMIVSVAEVRQVFINDNGSFRPMRQGEKINL